jgi:hypothetical protein
MKFPVFGFIAPHSGVLHSQLTVLFNMTCSIDKGLLCQKSWVMIAVSCGFSELNGVVNLETSLFWRLVRQSEKIDRMYQ